MAELIEILFVMKTASAELEQVEISVTRPDPTGNVSVRLTAVNRSVNWRKLSIIDQLLTSQLTARQNLPNLD